MNQKNALFPVLMLILSGQSFAMTEMPEAETAMKRVDTTEFAQFIANDAAERETVYYEIEGASALDENDPVDPDHPILGISGFLGNHIGIGLSLKFTPWLVADATGGMFELSSKYARPGHAGSTIEPGVFTTGLRAIVFKERLEFGPSYQAVSTGELTENFEKDFRKLGYEIRVNFVKFTDAYSKGNGKVFLAMNGFKKGSAAPNLFRAGVHWYFR